MKFFPRLIMSKSARFIFLSILKSLTIKRISNVIKVYSSLLLSNDSVRGMPIMVEMEPTTRCNLRCFSCPTGMRRLGRPSGDMKYENFKKIIDEIGNDVLVLVLYLHGEPFLNKDIYKMISYAKMKGIFVVASTNGNILDTKELIKSGLQYLIICLDGTTPEIYNKYRIGGNFDKVVENIKSIMKEKEGCKTPFIDLHFIVNKYNEHQISEIKKLSRVLGVDNLVIKKFVPPPFVLQSKNLNSYKRILSFLPKTKEYKYDLRISKKKNCNRIWISTTITWDGFLIPCCYDVSANYNFGNVFQKNFKSVWNGKEYRFFRQMLIKKSKIPLCFRCPGGIDVSVNEYIKF